MKYTNLSKCFALNANAYASYDSFASFWRNCFYCCKISPFFPAFFRLHLDSTCKIWSCFCFHISFLYFFSPVQCRFIVVNVHVPHYISFEFGFLFGICLMCIRCSVLGTRSPMFNVHINLRVHDTYSTYVCLLSMFPCFHVPCPMSVGLLFTVHSVHCSRISSAMGEAISFDSTLFKCAFDPIPVL